jgi:hypothetical protein
MTRHGVPQALAVPHGVEPLDRSETSGEPDRIRPASRRRVDRGPDRTRGL